MDLKNQLETIKNKINLDELNNLISQKDSNEDSDSINLAMLTLQKTSSLMHIRKELHSIISNYFHERFPDLASIVPDFTSYAILAKYLSNNSDINNEDIKSLLSQQQIVAVTLSLNQKLGEPFSSPIFDETCDFQIFCGTISNSLTQICSRCVEKFAPNMCALVGTEISALLITTAGGLDKLAMMPACNVQVLGTEKTALLGFSSKYNDSHKGFIYSTDIIQQADPQYRDMLNRKLSSKVTLCARVDNSKSKQDGSFGEKEKIELFQKMDKISNNTTPKYIRPLPVPDLVSTKTRGGREARAKKKKFGMSEELRKRQKVAFGVGGQFGEDGEQYGITAFQPLKKSAPKTDEPYQKLIEKKLQALENAGKIMK